MDTVIQFKPKQSAWHSPEEKALIAFMQIRDSEIKSVLCELILAIAREQGTEESN